MIGVDPIGLSPLGFAFGKKKPEFNPRRFHRVVVSRVDRTGRPVIATIAATSRVLLNNS